MRNSLVPWVLVVVSAAITFLALLVAVSGIVPDWVKGYNKDEAAQLASFLMSFPGWLLAFAGLLFAGTSALRGLVFNAVSDLQREESSSEQATAKWLVWKTAPPEGRSGNAYSYMRDYVSGLRPEDAKQLDEARRKLTHFWYRAARLQAVGVLSLAEIIETVGPPDIVAVLEKLEAIKAETIDQNWKPRAWPPMRLFIAWQKQQGHRADVRQVRARVPAQPDLYEQSKLEAASPTVEPPQTREGAQA